MKQSLIIDVLKKEIEKTTGCTDPGAVTFATAVAAKMLDGVPDRVEVTVSQNVYKNGINVGVPGTGKNGLHIAAALGVYLADKADQGLDILEHVDRDLVAKAQLFIDGCRVIVNWCKSAPDPLYIKASAYRGDENAWAVIQSDYSNIVETCKNGKVVISKCSQQAENQVDTLIGYKVDQLIQTILDIDSQELEFLIDAAMVNKKSALHGLNSESIKLGPAQPAVDERLQFPYSAMILAKTYTAAAAEARMTGLKVPIMAIAGSGNHGITNFLGTLAVAETLNAGREEMAKALAISSAITVYIKGFVKRMTAFCGCSVAAATGVAAATVYLIGGNYNDMVNAMHSVVGSLAGIVCDGAKLSCAYKLSNAASAAIEYGYLAKEKNAFIPPRTGIVSNTIETTFKNLGRLNNPGMVETDRCLLQIIESIQNG